MFFSGGWTEILSGAKTNTLFRSCSTECGSPIKPCWCGSAGSSPAQTGGKWQLSGDACMHHQHESLWWTHHHRPLLLTAPVPESEDTSRMHAAFTPNSSARLHIVCLPSVQNVGRKMSHCSFDYFVMHFIQSPNIFDMRFFSAHRLFVYHDMNASIGLK